MKVSDTIPVSLRGPRTSTWLILAALLLIVIGIVSPVQLPVVIYKVALIALAAVLAYWLDRVLFPYARPDGFLCRDWRYGTDEPHGDVDYPVVGGYELVYCAAMLRRALVVAAIVIGVATGL